jgi:TraX protein
MNQNKIKWLATLLMLIDHVGVLIELEPMRILGRLSFPLFAWVFAQNWQRPNEKKKSNDTIDTIWSDIADTLYLTF